MTAPLAALLAHLALGGSKPLPAASVRSHPAAFESFHHHEPLESGHPLLETFHDSPRAPTDGERAEIQAMRRQLASYLAR